MHVILGRMKSVRGLAALHALPVFVAILAAFGSFSYAHALAVVAGSNATTTPNVATSIPGFQITGNAASTTPVKLRVTSGTLTVSATTGVTISGSGSATVNLSGTVANLNTALSTLKYTRSSTGSDTLEVSLVNANQVYWSGNGHMYEYVSTSRTWAEAKAAAEAASIDGVPGYLATMSTTSENAFVAPRTTGDGWLGARDWTQEKRWVWETGPEAGSWFFQESDGGGGTTQTGWFAGWAGGEPNDYNGDDATGDESGGEDCGYMFGGGSGNWNDYPCSTSQGYIVEYGTDGNLPQVVAATSSIVTADVPALTALSPLNNATNVSSTANLVITFSKTVTADTGNILIKKDSDDSTVESIAVGSGQVTGGGSTSITINPSITFDDSTTYYVIIPSTAFKDASNNYFSGISSDTVWAFTTGDSTAPSLSSITASSTASTTAGVAWTSNESASSKVVFGLTSSYSSTTPERDTSSRVTSHYLGLAPLLSCTTYHYAAVSRDAALNSATSSDATFTTSGCTADIEPTAATSTAMTSSGGETSVEDGGKTFSVSVPNNATTSSFVIQVKAIPSDDVLATLGRPTAKPTEVGATVFDVKAIVNGTTEFDSFDAEVTIEYQYTDSEISGLDESTLRLYHYTNGSWAQLNACTVDTGANTISCTTPSFSIFGLFGSAISSGGGGGTTIQGRVANLRASGNLALADELVRQYPQAFASTQTAAAAAVTSGTCPKYTFTRSLKKGMTGEDVRALQQLMNCLGFKLGESGAGAPGAETDLFAQRTFDAVVKFQEKYASEILAPINATKGTGFFATYSIKKVHQLMGGE